ncbi:MAG: hypothetical protein ACYC9O_12690 [Candidatus Latescibacterota bacterium]
MKGAFLLFGSNYQASETVRMLHLQIKHWMLPGSGRIGYIWKNHQHCRPGKASFFKIPLALSAGEEETFSFRKNFPLEWVQTQEGLVAGRALPAE